MKKAVILHGTGGSPASNWFPWLKTQLEDKGYEVWVPALPNNETPNRHTYNDFLFGSGWDFTDNLVIGHSSGAVSVLNLLEDDRCPRIGTAVMVGVWTDTAKANLNHDGLTRERFKDLIPQEGFKPDEIKRKADHFLYLHGDNDPYCPVEQAKQLAEQTNSDIIVIPGGGHINHGMGYTELPQLTEALEERGWL